MEIWMANNANGTTSELVQHSDQEWSLIVDADYSQYITLDRKHLKDLHDAIGHALWGENAP